MFKKIIVSLLAITALVGCSPKTEEPVSLNSNRSTGHKYDFIQFIELSAFGPNGEAMLEVEPKDVTVDDFESEEEYIKIKKTIDSLKLNITPGVPNKEGYLQSDKLYDLTNGDIITLSISDSYTDPGFGADVNLEPFSLEISGLEEAEQLDLYDSSSVEFYGLEGTTEVFAHKKKGGVIPDEILDNIRYSISSDSSKLEEGKTILTINSEMDSMFLNDTEDPYYTTDIYLKKHGYAYKLSEEKVLQHVVNPIDFTKIKPEAVGEALFEEVNKQTIQRGGVPYYLDSIATVQQTKEEAGRTLDKYGYIVTALASNEAGEQICIRNNVRMVEFGNQINILSIGNTENIQMDYCAKNYDNTSMLMNFNVVEIEEESEETESKDSKTNSSETQIAL